MQRGGRGFARRAIETEIVLRELCEITQRRMRGEGGGERASELAGVVYLHSHTRTHTKHTRSHTQTHARTRGQFTVYSLQLHRLRARQRVGTTGRRDAMRWRWQRQWRCLQVAAPNTTSHTHTAHTHTDDTHDAENR